MTLKEVPKVHRVSRRRGCGEAGEGSEVKLTLAPRFDLPGDLSHVVLAGNTSHEA